MEFIDLHAQRKIIETEINNAIQKVLSKGQFILGEEVGLLEQKLARFVDIEHCITCANGTDALVLALRALDVKPGDEIIIPSFTFFATAEAVSLLGATPVLVDINPETYNIDPLKVEEKISSKTKAVIAVSLYGLCAELLQLKAICEKNNIFLIEDAAQSFGASMSGHKSCSIADISCTSFFPSKPLGCYGDGGALFTKNESFAKKLKELRAHGQEKRYKHVSIGYNSRLDTIQAAILIEKLNIFEDEIAKRQIVATKYNTAFATLTKLQKIPSNFQSVFAQYTIEVDNREEVQAKLSKAGIPTAVHYPIPLHWQPIYKSEHQKTSLIHSENASLRVMSLPMHPYLSEENQNHVIAEIKKLF